MLVAALLEYLHNVDVPLQKMCGLGNDGASVLVGKKSGVSARLKEQVTLLISNHCVAHKLALAVSQSTKNITYLKTFEDITDQLHRFYKYSSVRTAALRQIQALYDDSTLKMTRATDVSWLSHDLATRVLKNSLPAVISSLERERPRKETMHRP